MSGRKRIYNQLQWQRMLLHTGVPAIGCVHNIIEEKMPVPGYVQIRFQVMLRMNGHIAYRDMQTVLNKEELPLVGDMINIKYCPGNNSHVLVL